MKEKILIVEDQFVEADYLRLMLTKAGYQVTGIAYSIVQAQALIRQDRPDIVLLDIFVKGTLTGIDLAVELKEQNIAFVFLSANSDEEVLSAAKTTQPYGFLVKPFKEKDLLVMLEIAKYRHEHSVESNLIKENILTGRITSITSGTENWEKKLSDICRAIQSYIPFDYVTAGFNTISTPSNHAMSFLRIGFDDYQKIGVPELLTITRLKQDELITMANNTYHKIIPAFFVEKSNDTNWRRGSLNNLFAEKFEATSCITLPILLSDGTAYVFCFYSKKNDAYDAGHIALLTRLQKLITNGIEHMLYPDKQHTALSAGAKNSTPLSATAPEKNMFEGVVGKSPLLLEVFDLITQVAFSDTSVLILGESGTGKERIADSIHHLSPRRNKPFVKINCAALPSTLIESELFGHEKGSFTGALEKRIGKFEKADKGTIFLDEIGEMTPDLQVKLLRVLQEKCIERIGSGDVTKVDVRVIAATNRNLEKEVAEGRFRLDLYYRLNVFPIELPSLRDRIEDVPGLAAHFINIFNQKAGKKITGISDKTMKNLMAYHWPGNIRELENLMERSVLMAKGSSIEEIRLPVSAGNEHSNNSTPGVKTIHENERDYITSVLKKCNGKIWGAGGAAEILQIPPSTLRSKMKKLGIRKQFPE